MQTECSTLKAHSENGAAGQTRICHIHISQTFYTQKCNLFLKKDVEGHDGEESKIRRHGSMVSFLHMIDQLQESIFQSSFISDIIPSFSLPVTGYHD